jgi:hypothetical protein
MTLRERLLALRDATLRHLDEGEAIDAGLLSVAANAGAVLDMLDALDADTSRRGGDPRAEQRAERDEDIRTLAALLGSAGSVQQRAAYLADRLVRFRAMPNETSPERVLMESIVKNEAGTPGAERIRKILVKQKTRLDDQKPGLSLPK